MAEKWSAKDVVPARRQVAAVPINATRKLLRQRHSAASKRMALDGLFAGVGFAFAVGLGLTFGAVAASLYAIGVGVGGGVALFAVKRFGANRKRLRELEVAQRIAQAADAVASDDGATLTISSSLGTHEVSLFAGESRVLRDKLGLRPAELPVAKLLR